MALLRWVLLLFCLSLACAAVAFSTGSELATKSTVVLLAATMLTLTIGGLAQKICR